MLGAERSGAPRARHAALPHLPEECLTWAQRFGTRWQDLWRACPRADWMLQAAGGLPLRPEGVVRAATECLRIRLGGVPAVAETRATERAQALRALDSWARGSHSTTAALIAVRSAAEQRARAGDDRLVNWCSALEAVANPPWRRSRARP